MPFTVLQCVNKDYIYILIMYSSTCELYKENL